jgi:hypothetical protein
MTRTLIGGGGITDPGAGFRLAQATENGVDVTGRLELRVEGGNLVIGRRRGTGIYVR